MTTKPPPQHPFDRLATLRRQASTKATPLGYKPAATSPKKNPAAPPTGFAAIGSYNTIARRVTALMVGIPFVVVTSYILYHRVVLGREQRPLTTLTTPTEDPRTAEK